MVTVLGGQDRIDAGKRSRMTVSQSLWDSWEDAGSRKGMGSVEELLGRGELFPLQLLQLVLLLPLLVVGSELPAPVELLNFLEGLVLQLKERF